MEPTEASLSGTLEPAQSMKAFEAETTSLRSSSSLQDLIVLSDLAEHELALEELSGLVFQLQELRHTASASAVKPKTSAPGTNDATSDSVDVALGRLTERLEEIESAWDALKQICSDTKNDLVLAKVTSLDEQLATIRSDVDLLRSELGEDKIFGAIDVFELMRPLTLKADEMMTSLEKILASCHEFIWEINRPAVSAASSLSSSLAESRLASASSRKEQYHKLYTSLQAKKMYYVPSTKRVLSILEQGIAERRTQNGLVLKQFKEMRNRFKHVQERIIRIEQEMEAIQDVLEPSPSVGQQSTSLPSASVVSRETSPGALKQTKHDIDFSRQVPSSSSLSSIRRIASRLAPSSNAASPEPNSRSHFASSNVTPPARPRKNEKRQSMFALRSSNLSPPAHLASSTPPARPAAQNDRSATSQSPSHSNATSSLPRTLYTPTSDRGRSPGHGPSSSALSNRPQWNSSVKPVPAVQAGSSNTASRRPSLGGLGLPGSSTPSRQATRAVSAFGHYTPASMESRYRSFTPMPGTPSESTRAPSPAFSATSSPAEYPRARPESRNSRIPMPASAKKASRNRTVSSDVGSDDGFSDMGDTSLLSRAMSDQGEVSFYTSTYPANGDSELEEVLSTPGLAASSSHQPFFRGQLMTPEPQMRATASKIRSMTQNRGSLRPPSAASTRSRSSMGAPSSRRLSRAPSPLPGSSKAHYGTQPDGSYRPNPYDQLDLAIAALIERQPLHLSFQRIGEPISKNMGLAQKMEDWTAQYVFQDGKPVQCKLIQRTRNGEVIRKCMVKSGGQWVDLEMWLLDLQSF